MPSKFLRVTCALATLSASSVCLAGVDGTAYDASLSYGGDTTIANSQTLIVGASGFLDLPVGQLWSILTSATGSTISSQLIEIDATTLLAGADLTVTWTGITDPDLLALSVAGPLLVWFTPQMQPSDAIALLEGNGWTQTVSGNSFDLTLDVTPFSLTGGEFFGSAEDEIGDIHVVFDVVPEPGSLTLLLVAAAAVVRRRR